MPPVPEPVLGRPAPNNSGRERRHLLGLLVAAALLRLVLLSQIRPVDFLRGGDGAYYLRQAWLIAHHALPHPLTTAGPVYPLFLSFLWALFPDAPEPLDVGLVPDGLILLARLIQIGLSLLVVWLGYRLAREIGGDHRAGLITAFGLAAGPAFVLEPIYLLTEPLFIPLLTAAVWLYTLAGRSPSAARFALAGAFFGLAAMTRPVALLIPAALLPHLLITGRRGGWRRRAAAFVGVFALTLLPWMAYLALSTGNPLPEGFSANLWIGAVGQGRWEGGDAADRLRFEAGLEREDYIPEALRIIGADPLGWLALRARNLAGAVLTPHGTSDLGGPSIKELFAEWWERGRPLAGLGALLAAPSFGLKLVVYACHFLALVFGALGAWVARARWRQAVPLAAAIACLVGAYGVLTVLPRYLFPAEVFVWVLAGLGLSRLWDRRRLTPIPPGEDPASMIPAA